MLLQLEFRGIFRISEDFCRLSWIFVDFPNMCTWVNGFAFLVFSSAKNVIFVFWFLYSMAFLFLSFYSGILFHFVISFHSCVHINTLIFLTHPFFFRIKIGKMPVFFLYIKQNQFHQNSYGGICLTHSLTIPSSARPPNVWIGQFALFFRLSVVTSFSNDCISAGDELNFSSCVSSICILIRVSLFFFFFFACFGNFLPAVIMIMFYELIFR